MAKPVLDPRTNIDERALTVTGKRPSFAGIVSIRPDVSGKPYAAIFPPRRRVTTQRQMLASLWFKYMAYVYKITHSFFIENYRAQALGLWLQPRDIFTAAMSGRLFGFIDESGKKFFSTAMRRDMTESLDVLAQVPGAILFRGVQYWDGLLPGEVGQVLRIDADGLPHWSNIGDAVASESRTSGLIAQFYHSGQGAGLQTIRGFVTAIRLAGTAFSSVIWSVYSPARAHSAAVRLHFDRAGSDGGNYRHVLKSHVVKTDGSLVVHNTIDRVEPAPPPGGSEVYVWGIGDFLHDVDRVGLVLVYERLGSAPEDTNNSNSHLWFYEVNRW